MTRRKFIIYLEARSRPRSLRAHNSRRCLHVEQQTYAGDISIWPVETGNYSDRLPQLAADLVGNWVSRQPSATRAFADSRVGWASVAPAIH